MYIVIYIVTTHLNKFSNTAVYNSSKYSNTIL